jgi:Flp pilus assembly protein CpaB
MPRTRLFLIAAVVLALTTAWVVAGDLAALHRRAAQLGRARPMLVATSDLAAGATVKPADVDVRNVHEPAPGAVADKGTAVGRVVAVPVLAGSPVLERHLAPPGRHGPGALVPRGMRAVQVAVQPQWRLPPGSVVDVLATGEPPGTVAEGAVVLAGDGDVTLLVTVEAARRLASAAAAGPLTLALAPPEDACCTTSSSASSRD